MSFRHVMPVVAVLFTSLLVSCTGSGGGEDVIVLINRQNSSGTYKYFQKRVLDDNDFKSNTKDQSGSQAVVDLVGNMPKAIGYSGMGYKTDKVKFLRIAAEKGSSGVLPSVASTKDGSYPLTRPLQVYTKGQPQGAVAHYLQWILSAEGQEIVAAEGYGPLPPKPITAPPPAGDAAFQVTGSDTMLQLAQAWAAAYSEKFPDVKVQLTGGGSGVGIAGMIDGSVDIANASRKMKSTEIAKAKQNGVDPKEFEVAKDALSVYVHKDNPLDTITIADLAQIYGEDGKISTWQQIDGYSKGNEDPAP